MKFNKSLLLVAGVAVAVSAFASRLNGSIKELNDAAAAILEPFQNETTNAVLSFEKVLTDEVKTLEVKVTGAYNKLGNNPVALKISELSYNYAAGPLAKGSMFINFDLTKSFEQADINNMLPEFSNLIKNLAADKLADYGDAVVIEETLHLEEKDAEGNFLTVTSEFDLTTDFSKLPAGKTPRDVIAKSVKLRIVASSTTGIEIVASGIGNLEYKAFEAGEPGLKEQLEKFLGRDANQAKMLHDLFKIVDDFASGIVQGKQN